MNDENRNYILAIVLSVAVLIAWQIFIGIPQMREQEQRAARQEALQTDQVVPGTGTAPVPGAPTTQPGATVEPGAVPQSGAAVAGALTREAAIASTPRVLIATPDLDGSVNLVGGRIDDLSLTKYREEVDPESPIIHLLSPRGSPDPYYVESGWTVAPGAEVRVPTTDTEWTVERGGTLAPGAPVTLVWDNGAGLTFRRTISVDDHYMFTIEQSVENNTGEAVSLYPYGLVSRHGIPNTTNFFILHEGMIGVLGEEGLHEIDYDDLIDDGPVQVQSNGGWLGITDKYWATALVPDQTAEITGRFTVNTAGQRPIFQTDFLLGAVAIPAGETVSVASNVFAGAKETNIIQAYDDELNIRQFDLMIDWGWFYFLTKPMFAAIDYFFRLTGNFGLAILIVTVIVKLIFFPLANKSYVSMSRMKLVQPEMIKIRERFADDKQKQQQAMMELYKKEKINPLSGCLPILLQIPVFFALYKVLFVTIEMRHAPFFGWIQDLSAPDPTSIFNLFGLIPWDPPSLLMLGIWPLIMGITMFIQMKLNPAPPDPTQAMIFNWMPVIFTFMLASFPAGLVIYWAWNNFLSILQQYIIMRRQGVKVDIWDNIRSTFKRGSGKAGESKT